MSRLIGLLCLLTASAAFAHGGAHVVPLGPPGWTLDPLVTGPLALVLGLYGTGMTRLRWREGLWRRAAIFIAGWLVLALSLVSPLHEAGERSFTLHMIEHELIMLVAALLLPLSRPWGVMLWAFPRHFRRTLGKGGRWMNRLATPGRATFLQAAMLWLWHAPPLFNRALGHPGWHIAQHLSFLLTALIFWWAMLRTPNRGVAALYLFITSVTGAALGALMALSASPWYAAYAAMGMMPFGLTPSEDQALAGLIMWVPGGLVHAGAAIVILRRSLLSGENHRRSGPTSFSGSPVPADPATVATSPQRG